MALTFQEALSAFIKMLFLSTTMSASSYVCGLIPLSIKLSPLHLRYLSVLSMGILLSTSFILIIPEGISGIFETREKSQAANTVGLLALLGFVLMYIIDHIHVVGAHLSKTVSYTGMDAEIDPQGPRQQSETRSGIWHRNFAGPIARITKPLASSPLTLGLVIHSVTDGIVLTSSIFSKNESLNLIMFIAIFIHKLPTSFSLVSLLIAEGLQKSVVKLHLFIFSASLMVGSLLSFIGFQIFSGLDEGKTEYQVASMLMLSGGTFFYIGVHTMIEILGHSESLPRNTNSGPEDLTATSSHSSHSLELIEFGISLVGFVLPVFALIFKE